MHNVTIDISKERRRLESVGNKIGYGYVSVSNYYGNNKKFHIITNMKFVGNNTTIITLESQEDGAKTSWKLFYNKYGKSISVTANNNKYDKLLLQKKIKIK